MIDRYTKGCIIEDMKNRESRFPEFTGDITSDYRFPRTVLASCEGRSETGLEKISFEFAEIGEGRNPVGSWCHGGWEITVNGHKWFWYGTESVVRKHYEGIVQHIQEGLMFKCPKKFQK